MRHLFPAEAEEPNPYSGWRCFETVILLPDGCRAYDLSPLFSRPLKRLPHFWTFMKLRQPMLSAEVAGAEGTPERQAFLGIAVLASQSGFNFRGLR